MKALKWTLVLALVALIGAGCQKSPEKKGEVRTRGGGGVASGPGLTPGGGTGGFQSQTGNLTGFQGANGDFAPVKALVSATMNPDTDMDTPIHGIALAGDIKVDGVTNILNLGGRVGSVNSTSAFALYIFDQRAKDGDQAITVSFKPGSYGAFASGQVTGSQVNLKFTDDYGDVLVTGTFTATEFTGNVGFKNKVGAYAGQSLQLGQFKVPTCGFFHCQ